MKKRSALMAVASLLWLAQPTGVQPAKAAAPNGILVEDAFWDSMEYNPNYDENYVGRSDLFGQQHTALKFILPDGAGVVTSAKLRFYVKSFQDANHTDTIVPHVTIIGSTKDEWPKNTDFDQSPLFNTGDQVIGKSQQPVQMGLNEFDVTDFVNNQFAGDKVVTFVLQGSDPGYQLEFAIAAMESRNLQPELLLEIGPGVTQSNPPQAEGTTTAEDMPSVNGLTISPNEADDQDTVTHYKITEITGGTLYKKDSSIPLEDSTFISAEEGSEGLTFAPAPNANTKAGNTFSFKVQAAQDAAGKGLSDPTTVTIHVTEVNDVPLANDDTSLEAIDQNSGDRIIPFETLLVNDTAGTNESDQVLTIIDAEPVTGGTVHISGRNVIFTPETDFRGQASFRYTVEDNGTTNGDADGQTAVATVSFDVLPSADKPTVDIATTAEDTVATVKITPASAGSGAVTNFYKITGINGGTLSKSNGITPVTESSFITTAEGSAGLKFMPDQDANGPTGFGFLVQAAPMNDGTKLSDVAAATVIVTEVNDAPVAMDDLLSEVAEDSGPRTITVETLLSNDSAGASNESGQTLTLTPVEGSATGGTVIVNEQNDLFFTPEPNFHGTASFEYDLTDNGTTNGEAKPETDRATVSFTVTPVADIPSVTPASSEEDDWNQDGLKITPNTEDGAEVTHFKITGISGGELYKNDQTTPIQNGDFITKQDGDSGLKFKPAEHANTPAGDSFSFQVQAALGLSDTGLSPAAVGTITVSEVNDPPVAVDDNPIGAVPRNSGEHTFAADKLLENDSELSLNEAGQTRKVIEVEAVEGGTVRLEDNTIYFTPEQGFGGNAKFKYTIEDNGTTNGELRPQTAQAIATVRVLLPADRPTVEDTTTAEDTLNSDGLVITPAVGSGSVTEYFKITGITGGTLYMKNGATEIHNGDFISVDDGQAGLKFLPAENVHGNTGFGFKVQAAPSQDDALISEAVEAVITVTEVNDPPTAVDDIRTDVALGTEKVIIPFEALTGNDSVGPLDEQLWQSLKVVAVEAIAGGTVSIVDGQVEFIPEDDFTGTASFTYTVEDDGRTEGIDNYESDTATMSFNIVDASQPIIELHGDQTVYLLQGEEYVEPGYAASDDRDGDLTNQVTVSDEPDSMQLGTYILHYNVKDSSNNSATEVTRKVQVVSNLLEGLTVDGVTLSPAFESSTSSYKVQVPNQVKELKLTADTLDLTASLTVNGMVKTSGEAASIHLQVGKNDVTVIVTAQGGATKSYELEVTRQVAASNPDNSGNSDNNGNSGDNGNSSNNPITAPAQTRQAKVVTGDAPIVQVDITRSTNASGNVVDAVKMNKQKAAEVVARGAADASKTASIVIDDIPGQPADEVTVNVDADALLTLKEAGLALAIEAGGAKITLPHGTVDQLTADGKALFFRLVPIREASEQQEVEDRVIETDELEQYAQGRAVKALGEPMTIETNYTSRMTKVMLPLKDIELPADQAERDTFLKTLAIFVEHTDGDKAVEAPTIVYDAEGKPVGLEIEIEKFSTFTIISADEEFQSYWHYISGYTNGTFRPNAEITRAELVSMIARQMELDRLSLNDQGRYPDVADTHWAYGAIHKMSRGGFVAGDPNGQFRPNAAVTRAEMAVIAAKVKGLSVTGSASAFSDTQGHWGASSISAVQAAGLMVGSGDGTFRPSDTLTRAEAIAVINRLFQRPALQELSQPTWPDVPLNHWAASDIESASNDLRAFKDGSVEKIDE
ncbi:Ig-like domain-containing protein [Neobacillus mesonae]|nr:Ig-like domain-containing protein [Neobacillus mesonae]